VDTATFLGLGALGGSLRGLVDAYNQTMGWQAARREYRRARPPEDRPVPQFSEFFDPVPDAIATAFHMMLGAAVAATFGTSGQITGAYAAVTVGISAPALLTQLGRVQGVGDAITGDTAARPDTATPPHRTPTARVPDQALPSGEAEGTL
jgi:hypothetical protein